MNKFLNKAMLLVGLGGLIGSFMLLPFPVNWAGAIISIMLVVK